MLTNFSFVIENKLAGMARPGRFDDLEDDLKEMEEHNIKAVVSLTEVPLDNKVLQQKKFAYLHLPIVDYSIPTLKQIKQFIDFTNEINKQGKAVAVHCAAGIGRTGTMLACYLVNIGYKPIDAITTIRKLRPGSIETSEQEQVIIKFAENRN